MKPLRLSQLTGCSSLFFQTMLHLPCQTVEKRQIRFIRNVGSGPLDCFHFLSTRLARNRLLPASSLVFFEVVLNLTMHPLVKRLTHIGISLLVKVVLVSGERFFTLPFHV